MKPLWTLFRKLFPSRFGGGLGSPPPTAGVPSVTPIPNPECPSPFTGASRETPSYPPLMDPATKARILGQMAAYTQQSIPAPRDWNQEVLAQIDARRRANEQRAFLQSRLAERPKPRLASGLLGPRGNPLVTTRPRPELTVRPVSDPVLAGFGMDVLGNPLSPLSPLFPLADGASGPGWSSRPSSSPSADDGGGCLVGGPTHSSSPSFPSFDSGSSSSFDSTPSCPSSD